MSTSEPRPPVTRVIAMFALSSGVISVVSLGIVLVLHRAAVARGPYDICTDLIGTTTGTTVQNSLLPYGFYCSQPSRAPVFYDLGTAWVAAAVIGFIATLLLTIVWARAHLASSASSA